MVYEESQKKFTGVMKQVEEEVGKFLETQSTADSTVFMDKSFNSLRRYSNSFNSLPFIPVVVGHGGHASCLADFSVGECVSLSLEDIPLATRV